MKRLIFIILIALAAFIGSGCASTNHCDAYRKSDVTKHSDSIEIKKMIIKY